MIHCDGVAGSSMLIADCGEQEGVKKEKDEEKKTT